MVHRFCCAYLVKFRVIIFFLFKKGQLYLLFCVFFLFFFVNFASILNSFLFPSFFFWLCCCWCPCCICYLQIGRNVYAETYLCERVFVCVCGLYAWCNYQGCVRLIRNFLLHLILTSLGNVLIFSLSFLFDLRCNENKFDYFNKTGFFARFSGFALTGFVFNAWLFLCGSCNCRFLCI